MSEHIPLGSGLESIVESLQPYTAGMKHEVVEITFDDIPPIGLVPVYLLGDEEWYVRGWVEVVEAFDGKAPSGAYTAAHITGPSGRAGVDLGGPFDLTKLTADGAVDGLLPASPGTAPGAALGASVVGAVEGGSQLALAVATAPAKKGTTGKADVHLLVARRFTGTKPDTAAT